MAKTNSFFRPAMIPETLKVGRKWGGDLTPGFVVDPPQYQVKKRRRGSKASEAKRAMTWQVMQHMQR